MLQHIILGKSHLWHVWLLLVIFVIRRTHYLQRSSDPYTSSTRRSATQNYFLYDLSLKVSKVLETFRNFCTSKLSNAIKIFNKVIFRNDEEILGVAFNAAKINLQNNPSKMHRRKIRQKMEFRESGKNTFPTFLKNKPWVHKSSPPIKLWAAFEVASNWVRKHNRRWSTFPLLYRKPLLWRSELIIFFSNNRP